MCNSGRALDKDTLLGSFDDGVHNGRGRTDGVHNGRGRTSNMLLTRAPHSQETGLIPRSETKGREMMCVAARDMTRGTYGR